MPLEPLKVAELPKAPSLRKLIGPSFIILGLGLGSGEVVLWPYLSANYGLGIIWAAILGITFQFFMNMEIERYALARGESVFVGLARKIRWLPFWFILSTFIPWVWPGIIVSSATLLGTVVGVTNIGLWSLLLLLLIGLILTLGPVLYKTVETLQKWLIILGVPTIFVLSILLTNSEQWVDLGKGIVGVGHNFFFLPEGIILSSFLAALAYAGAGGNLNLAQAFYIREKGYGMGKYSGKIMSLITGKKEVVSLTGSRFLITKNSLAHFKNWWQTINWEHFLVFWLTGSITIVMLALLSYVTVFGKNQAQGLGFVISEAKVMGERILPVAGTFFLLMTGLTLFGTQLTVLDATSRILAENTILALHPRTNETHLARVYYGVLWLQILGGMLILLVGFKEPLALLTLAAVLNAVSMFVHVGLTLWLNLTALEKPLRPGLFRIAMMTAAFLFYGGFSLITLLDKLI